MKKILFIVNSGKISSNTNGGASVYFSHLELLYQAGYEVSLLTVLWSEKDAFSLDDYEEVKCFVKSIESYEITRCIPDNKFKRSFQAIFKPEKFEYNFLNSVNETYLQTLVNKKSIDLVWAEWRWAGIWSGFSNLPLPVIYAHHDWEFKLARLRKKQTLLNKFHTFQKKRVEFRLVKKVSGCISGSATEARELEIISKKQAIYIPTTYKEVQPQLEALSAPNIIHLGGMATTANRLGLERFLDICWDQIHQVNPLTKLVVIGSLENATESLKEKLKGKQIVCKGFVSDLQTVLHPEDIHIIPWEYNTGTRTRIPIVLNYEQVLVATKEAARCFPEITENKNAILCSTLMEMTEEINVILHQKKRRVQLATEGKRTFERYFTTEGNLHQFSIFVGNYI